MQALPIDSYLEHVRHCSQQARNLIITAAPGSGKSTRIPPALLEEQSGQVLVLQPRRAAARSIARRIASEQGWAIGQEIGWQVRYERKGGRDTRLWLMTEGVLTRRLIKDPFLEGVSCVVLDEFHERHIDGDVILAWVKNLQQTVRPDLQLLVMSATLETTPLEAYLDDVQCIAIEVEHHELQIEQRMVQDQKRWLDACGDAVLQAATNVNSGAILVFLPGVGEIKRLQQQLEDSNCTLPVQTLYGAMSADEQDAVLTDESRRIILSTNIAETSLTVPGVRTVVDSGRERMAYYNPDNGLDELRLQDCSQFSATQRAGRAAREDRGKCIRLWSRAQQQRRAQSNLPEIARIDLAPLALRLKHVHGHDLRTLPWFEAPPAEQLDQAEALLVQLQLSEAAYAALTQAGMFAASLPVHPRLARMLMYAAGMQRASLAASIAAICSERDVRRPQRGKPAPVDPAPSDMFDRLCIVHGQSHVDNVDRRAVREVLQARRDIIRAWGDEDGEIFLSDDALHDHIAQLLISAWPDRIGKRSSATANTGKLCGGVGVRFEASSALYLRRGDQASELFVAAVIQGLRRRQGGAHYVRLAASIDEEDLRAVLGADCIRPHYQMRYRADIDKVQSQLVWRYQDLDLKLQQDARASLEQISQCLADALAPQAEQVLSEDEDFARYQQRLAFLRAHSDLDIPQLDCEHLLRDICARADSKQAVLAARPLQFLKGQLDYQLQQQIDEQAPEEIHFASGRSRRIDYDGDNVPTVSIRIQDAFGTTQTPRIAGGKVALKIELLAPNNRPAQITDDLERFWNSSYALVRKDLKGRYPKHKWPEDPHAQ